MSHFSGDLLFRKVASHNSLISTPQRRYIYYPLMFAFPFVIYWDSLLLKSIILLVIIIVLVRNNKDSLILLLKLFYLDLTN